MPTTGGATSNSTCVSPRTSRPTTHRSRVVDLTTEADKATDSVDLVFSLCRIQAFEESTESNKLELEKNEEKLAEFEGQIEEERNEGLFFKNLGQKKTVEKEKTKDEMEKIRDLTKQNAEIKTRRNIYLAMISLLIIEIVDSLITSPSNWLKVPILGVILVGVLSQVIYEHSMLSETERKQESKTEEEKE